MSLQHIQQSVGKEVVLAKIHYHEFNKAVHLLFGENA